jgi:hypothetical protein
MNCTKTNVLKPEALRNGEADPGEFRYGANAAADEGKSPDGVAQPTDTAPTKPANPFSREALRLNNNYAALFKTETHQHSIPVDKPPSEVWFRVHPDRNEAGDEFYFDTYLLQLKNGPDRGTYQVSAHLLPYLRGKKALKPMRLVLCIDTQGELRLWPLRLPGEDGREDDWMSSSLSIAEQAKHQWVRMEAGANGFKSETTDADIPEPTWPNKTFDEILDIAFAKKRIAQESDPILRRLCKGI